MRSNDIRTIKSVETTFEIIEYLRRKKTGTISEIADELDRSPGTVHTHLSTLRKWGFVVQPDQQYRLGPQFLPFGEHVRHHSELYQAAHEQVDELAQQTSEAAHLIIEYDGRIYTLYEHFGSDAVGVEYHSKKRQTPLDHLHCTAAGKVIIAHASKERRRQLLTECDFQPTGVNTITDPNEFRSELETVADRGVAFANEEQIKGIRAVGAPIVAQDGPVLGAITVSGPTTRLKAERFRDHIPSEVLHAAEVAELNLQAERNYGGQFR